MSFRRFQAKFVLAGLFFVHLFRRIFLFWVKPRGLADFLESFGPDAIFPVDPVERLHFPTFTRCQVCSLCTFSCTAVQQGKAHASFEPKNIMIGFGRSSHEAEVFLEDWLPCLECGECTVLCPNDVPVHRMAQVVKNRRTQLRKRLPT